MQFQAHDAPPPRGRINELLNDSESTISLPTWPHQHGLISEECDTVGCPPLIRDYILNLKQSQAGKVRDTKPAAISPADQNVSRAQSRLADIAGECVCTLFLLLFIFTIYFHIHYYIVV